jgi:hypothetical protein
MGIRCLLGHDFGDPELERDREEQGDEVVVTVSEQQTCTRCGATKVVSENTEVTSLEQLTETADDEAAAGEATDAEPAADAPTATAAGEPSADSQPADESGGSVSAETAPEAQTATGDTADAETDGVTITDDAEVLTDEAADTAAADATDAADDATDTPADPDEAADPDAAADDGVILTESESSETAAEGDDTSDAEPDESGESVDTAAESDAAGEAEASTTADTEAESTRMDWPDQQADDDGFDASSPSDAGPDDVSFGGGFTPEASTTDHDGADVIEEPGSEQLTKADEVSISEPTPDEADTEFYCPECGFTQPAVSSSMRAGDICPECRRGYIAEQRR